MLDIIMNGLDERFNQDTKNIISSIDKLLNLDITNTDLNILSNHFKWNYDEFVSEIRILKKDDTTPKRLTKSITSIVHLVFWLQ